MNCLYCAKPLLKKENSWHTKCLKSFFGTSTLPIFNLSEKEFNKILISNINNGITVPGVQKKLSLNLEISNNPKLTLLNYPTGYILKPNSKDYPYLPELEYLTMQMAKITDIKTVPFALIETLPKKNYAYITKRIDRIFQKKSYQKLAMEDFCQLSEKLAKDKYHGSYEMGAKIIKKYSSQPGIDLAEYFLRIVFSFAVGNSDMHLKNFSLILINKEYRLAEAYDLLATNIVIPEDKEQLALTLNGKKSNLKKNDFLEFAQNINIPLASSQKMIEKVVKLENIYSEMVKNSYISKKQKGLLEKLIKERMDILKK